MSQSGSNGTGGISPSGGFKWNIDNSASTPALAGNGYVIVFPSASLTLPAVNTLGDTIKFVGDAAGGFTIAQAANNQIVLASGVTTAGASGSVTSASGQYCTITLVGIGQLAGVYTWVQTEASQGIFTTH